MTVGERIVEARKSKGITQKALAEMTGIPIQTLVRIEKDRTGLKSNVLEKISVALQIKPSVLVGWVEDDETINEEVLSSFTTQELFAEIERRWGQ